MFIACTQGEVRLVNGTTPDEGRVELCFRNVWGTVCAQNFDTVDASVVCRQLGYAQESAVALFGANVVDGTGQIWFSNSFCTGAEARLIDCHRGSALGVNTCQHSQDVGARCTLRKYSSLLLALSLWAARWSYNYIRQYLIL